MKVDGWGWEVYDKMQMLKGQNVKTRMQNSRMHSIRYIIFHLAIIYIPPKHLCG